MSFTVNGKTYRCEPLPVIKAYDVSRKWAPVLIGLGMIKTTSEKEKRPLDSKAIAKAMVAMSAGLDQDASDFVVNTCLASVLRQEAGGWQKVTPGNGVMQFNDISMADMMEILYHVAEANGLPDFFAVPLAPATEDLPAQA